MGEPNCVDGRCTIQGGTFTMGSPAGVGGSDERPQKQVTMTTFRIGQTEVSLGEYKRYLAQKSGVQLKAVLSGCAKGEATRTMSGNAGETMEQLRRRAAQVFVSGQCGELKVEQVVTEGLPMTDYCGEANGKSDAHPVTCLKMQEKRDYCQAQGGDLPTAAQLHFASRHDEQDSVTRGKDQRIIWDNGFRTTQPVTSGYQNRFGVYNLLGNVWESALDAYDRFFYARMASTNPYNPMTNPGTLESIGGQLEELSGGSFYYYAWHARAAYRLYDDPGSRDVDVGFRCAWPQDSN